MRLTLDLRRLKNQFTLNAQEAEPDREADQLKNANDLSLCSLMLLLLVLRDFAQNRLPLGFAVNRGMGEVKDVSFRISGAYEISYADGTFTFGDAELQKEMQAAWDEVEF